MQPVMPSIWLHESNCIASRKPGTLQFASGSDGWSWGGDWRPDSNYREVKLWSSGSNLTLTLYARKFDASAGATYSISFETWCPNMQAGTLNMDIEWSDQSGNVVGYTGRAQCRYPAGNWTRFAANSVGTAPQGATRGMPRIFVEGATITPGGGCAVRRMQVEKSTEAHPWVEYSDPGSVQAQVQTNAAAIADIRNNRLAAYWQVVSTAGNQSASISAVAQSGGTTYSAIELVASQVTIRTSSGQTVPTLSVIGNDVVIAGNLVTTSSLRGNTVSSTSTVGMNGTVLYGQGVYYYQTAFSYSINLKEAADVQILWTGRNGYSSGLRGYRMALYLDGNLVSDIGDDGAFQSNPIILKTVRGVSAGSHTIEGRWSGADRTISFFQGEAAIQGLYR